MEDALAEMWVGPAEPLGERWERDWERGIPGSSESWPEDEDGEGEGDGVGGGDGDGERLRLR